MYIVHILKQTSNETIQNMYTSIQTIEKISTERRDADRIQIITSI